MKESELTYNNMVEKLPEELPDLRSRFSQETAWLSEKNSPYMVYEFVLYKHIAGLLKSKKEDESGLKKAFAFLEKLLSHSDGRVRDVADQSVCEAICSDEIVLQKAQRYMGPGAKKSCADYIGHKPKK